jgi:hypothetical protein
VKDEKKKPYKEIKENTFPSCNGAHWSIGGGLARGGLVCHGRDAAGCLFKCYGYILPLV